MPTKSIALRPFITPPVFGFAVAPSILTEESTLLVQVDTSFPELESMVLESLASSQSVISPHASSFNSESLASSHKLKLLNFTGVAGTKISFLVMFASATTETINAESDTEEFKSPISPNLSSKSSFEISELGTETV